MLVACGPDGLIHYVRGFNLGMKVDPCVLHCRAGTAPLSAVIPDGQLTCLACIGSPYDPCTCGCVEAAERQIRRSKKLNER